MNDVPTVEFTVDKIYPAIREPSLIMRPRLRRLSPHGVEGYTLVELVVVIFIVSLLAATGMAIVRIPLRRAQFESLLTEIKGIDGDARSRGRAGEDVLLRLDAEQGRIQLLNGKGQELRSAVQTAGGASVASVAQIMGTGGFGKATVPVGEAGTSPSYAICLRDSRGRFHWLVFMGLTGQCLTYEQESLPLQELLR